VGVLAVVVERCSESAVRGVVVDIGERSTVHLSPGMISGVADGTGQERGAIITVRERRSFAQRRATSQSGSWHHQSAATAAMGRGWGHIRRVIWTSIQIRFDREPARRANIWRRRDPRTPSAFLCHE
jgi:hypothetical protein